MEMWHKPKAEVRCENPTCKRPLIPDRKSFTSCTPVKNTIIYRYLREKYDAEVFRSASAIRVCRPCMRQLTSKFAKADTQPLEVRLQDGTKVFFPVSPKKPLSPYMVFQMEKRQDLLADQPNLPFSAIGTKLGEYWRKLTQEEKETYTVRYKEEYEVYKKKRQTYEREVAGLMQKHNISAAQLKAASGHPVPPGATKSIHSSPPSGLNLSHSNSNSSHANASHSNASHANASHANLSQPNWKSPFDSFREKMMGHFDTMKVSIEDFDKIIQNMWDGFSSQEKMLYVNLAKNYNRNQLSKQQKQPQASTSSSSRASWPPSSGNSSMAAPRSRSVQNPSGGADRYHARMNAQRKASTVSPFTAYQESILARTLQNQKGAVNDRAKNGHSESHSMHAMGSAGYYGNKRMYSEVGTTSLDSLIICPGDNMNEQQKNSLKRIKVPMFNFEVADVLGNGVGQVLEFSWKQEPLNSYLSRHGTYELQKIPESFCVYKDSDTNGDYDMNLETELPEDLGETGENEAEQSHTDAENCAKNKESSDINEENSLIGDSGDANLKDSEKNENSNDSETGNQNLEDSKSVSQNLKDSENENWRDSVTGTQNLKDSENRENGISLNEAESNTPNSAETLQTLETPGGESDQLELTSEETSQDPEKFINSNPVMLDILTKQNESFVDLDSENEEGNSEMELQTSLSDMEDEETNDADRNTDINTDKKDTDRQESERNISENTKANNDQCSNTEQNLNAEQRPSIEQKSSTEPKSSSERMSNTDQKDTDRQESECKVSENTNGKNDQSSNIDQSSNAEQNLNAEQKPSIKQKSSTEPKSSSERMSNSECKVSETTNTKNEQNSNVEQNSSAEQKPSTEQKSSTEQRSEERRN